MSQRLLSVSLSKYLSQRRGNAGEFIKKMAKKLFEKSRSRGGEVWTPAFFETYGQLIGRMHASAAAIRRRIPIVCARNGMMKSTWRSKRSYRQQMGALRRSSEN